VSALPVIIMADTKKGYVDPVSVTSAATFADVKKRLHAPWEGSGNELTAAILRLHFVIFAAIENHNAKGVGLGMAFVPYTDADVVNWCNNAHADANADLIERLEDVSTLLAQLHAHIPSSTANDKAILEHTKKMLIQTANASLVNTLIATIGQEGFKTLENHQSHKDHQNDFSVIPKAHTLQYYKHSFQVLFSAFADMFARKMTGSSVKHISINTPPEVEKETIDEFKKTMKDAADILINKKISTADVLVDHLMALALIHYINMADDNKNCGAITGASTKSLAPL
jgi:hypothetical protein